MLQTVTEMKKATTRKRATYEDLLKVPDHMVAELIDGVLYTFARPAEPHAWAYTRLIAQLDRFQDDGDGPGGWRIYAEPELHVGDDVLVPDIAGWRIGRMPTRQDVKYFTLAPDWVCEILSPSTWRLDRTKKLRVYARERVAHVWFIDALAKTFEVLTLAGRQYLSESPVAQSEPGDVRRPDGTRVRAVPFEALDLNLTRLWG